MGARVAIGARWWGGDYKRRAPYVFPEPEPLGWLPLAADPRFALVSLDIRDRFVRELLLLLGYPAPGHTT